MITTLGNAGGFSGSQFWKIDTTTEQFCLKRWPSRFDDVNRLQWINRVLRFAQTHGCPQVIAACRTASGESYVAESRFLWELSPWAKGSADFADHPNPDRLRSAIETVARFHLATAGFHLVCSLSPNLASIVGSLDGVDRSLRRIQTNLRAADPFLLPDDWAMFQQTAPRLAGQLRLRLQPLANIALPLQPVIRDLRREHLFFVGDAVTGIIDFDAMRVDTVAGDLSRLLGELIGLNPEHIEKALDFYETFRPLSTPERCLIQPLIQTGVVLGIIHWLIWICVDQRRFDDPSLVKARLRSLFTRLQ